MSRAQRALVAAAAVAPVTISGLALIRCHCSTAAWTIEVATALVFALWVLGGRKW